ncbi:hypothetical protein LTR09_001802 [Extremus antarcticus]|uniref:LCCL domain-containing protein n=1 Tax=Extremus antarcticus TaxID=702011 RepID=A0AAJ0LWC5_9PEZI|nr:hypothetical protein LTR09_001802 [Extremus antarcticus]
MNPQGRGLDEEAANGFADHEEDYEPYRDSPDEDDDVDVNGAQPDAPLRGPQRPSVDLDHYLGHNQATWRDRISDRIPPWSKSAWEATVTWTKGPDPPRIYSIDPIFPKIQHAPLALLDRYAPKKIHKFGLLLAVYFSWLLAFSLVLWKSSFAASIPGHGTPIRLGCQARYWEERNGCGINGDLCRPFANSTLAFRCPAECGLEQIYNPHAVGDQEVVYKPLVVGGPTSNQTGFEDTIVNNAIYRGDSFICASAFHAGFITDAQGGCGVLTLTGEQSSFTASSHHGIKSVPFDSYFPHTFGFLTGTRAACADLRWPALAVTVVFTTLLSLFTTSPAIFFWSIFVSFFFHVALASDPPNLTTYSGLLSLALGRFLPACFCAWVTYRYTALRTLTNLTAQFEKTILYLGPAWLGALNNYTFDKLPLQRLTPHDIKAQPGAIPALVIVVLSIFFIALGQAWAFRVEGRMPRYLALYGGFVGTILFFVALPGLSLRIHHYVLALLLLPGTSFQNRPSLIYQGLLLGLFINGVARWGFASVLETPSSLLEGSAQGTLRPVVSVLTAGAKNITFDLGPLPVWDAKMDVSWDGVSVLVNDVERFRGYGDDRSYWPGEKHGGNFMWMWERHLVGSREEMVNEGENVETAASEMLPEYFRFGYMSGSSVGDFTKAGKWEVDGGWKGMEKGPS